MHDVESITKYEIGNDLTYVDCTSGTESSKIHLQISGTKIAFVVNWFNFIE